MSLFNDDALRLAFELAVGRSTFSMTQLFEQVRGLGGIAFVDHTERLLQVLGERPTRHVLQGLLRSSFLIETILTRGGATKMSVRWSPVLANDRRGASFEECSAIFEALLEQLHKALADANNRLLLLGFTSHKLVSYEIPVDYLNPSDNIKIHRIDNIAWDWSELPFRVVRLRQLLRSANTNPFASAFAKVYTKIAVKTYLTDRAQTGEHQTNREKRWEAHPSGFQFALRRDCWSVENALINQICHFEDFPGVVFASLVDVNVIQPMPTPYRCPITLDPLSFVSFRDEVLSPTHGRARFQIGHLNPLRGIGGSVVEGHTAANIGWITADGNRIQGHLSLVETRALLKRIADNYRDNGLS